MNVNQTIQVGFLGAGGIARAHAYALQSLKYYYDQVPDIRFESVCSATAAKREWFASRYGFGKAQAEEEFFQNEKINTVYILGPNNVHFRHFRQALEMPGVRFIYIEKPVCASYDEERQMIKMLENIDPEITIQTGFQYLQTASVREALRFWKSGTLGLPVHFDLKYYHGDYLQKSYRDKRQTRLTPAPDGGAMADLGSHGISLLMAFLGERLQLLHALQAGHFPDVPTGSDLFSLISLCEPTSKAAGTLSASRISSGTGDLVALELYAEKGCLKYSSRHPEYFEYFLEETGQWTRQVVGSNYKSISSFPSGHVPPGWLRSMVHAHYLFLTGNDPEAFVPDLKHGLAVQRLVRETAVRLKDFRKIEIL
ncbi:MAG: Gfo/Idh/MocA family oxidoreductase [Prolixibacteraceae bacterium]|jgi:predicted dehydrogenase|nr:Gfo/Idh/MocA family oxidoreductase [Prolixibacteraceae bacterium]